MLGLFGTLDLGARALQINQQGLEVTGQNIANANNPAYARQRLQIQTSPTIDTELGPQGTGVQATAIVSLRSALLDQQIQSETSVSSYLSAQQTALQDAEASLGQTIDTSGSSSSDSLDQGLSNLFNAFQNLSSDPSSSTQRQVLVMQAADLASRFNQTDQSLGTLQSQLNTSLQSDVTSANDLLSQIASLNTQICKAEAGSTGAANDLRDLREQKLEDLAKLTNFNAATDSNGAVDISIGGTTLVSGGQVSDSLETYDAGNGQLLVRAQNAGTPLTLTGGSIAGTIDARDGQVASLRSNLNTLASTLISQVNTLHSAGYNLSGGTGAAFFTGTGAADIQVNSALLNDPTLVQASGAAGASGDNQVALALGQLANQPITALNGQTFSQSYDGTAAALGQALASVNANVTNQNSVQTMLSTQRDSVSGVSLDEEMTNLMKYQQAYAASARVLSTVDQMLYALMNIQ